MSKEATVVDVSCPGERYLLAAMAGKVPVSVHFVDGETMEGIIVSVGKFTLLLEHASCSLADPTGLDTTRTLVYKNALKKIAKSRTQ